ncbi:MAG: tRNA 2-thiouridine synthesizing protein A [Halocynthiibacter sp.]|jgi:tRNA 2-thiouridine synthesizing protein A
MKFAIEIDALGLLCPLPVLRVRKALAGMEAGALLRIEADDPMAAIDIPHFCAQAEYEVVLAEAPVFIIKAKG